MWQQNTTKKNHADTVQEFQVIFHQNEEKGVISVTVTRTLVLVPDLSIE